MLPVCCRKQIYSPEIEYKKLDELLINIEHCQYKFEYYSRWECIKIQGIPENTKIKNLEDTVTKMLYKIGISVKKYIIVPCHRLGKIWNTLYGIAN